MWQAALTLLGVVLGAAIAGGVSLWQVQLITAREREVRQTLREQERRDRRESFQRDAILALQGPVEDYWQLVTDWLNQATGATTTEGSDPPARPPYELMLQRNALFGRLNATRAHVFNDELRRLTEDVKGKGVFVTVAKSRDVKEVAWSRGDESLGNLHERVNTLLRDLI